MASQAGVGVTPDTRTDKPGSELGAPPSLLTLFLGFCTVSVSGFGGVLPFARRMIVEDRKWLTGPEFTAVLSLCQFLPGPNIVNVSIMIGSRFQGVPGALVAFVGLVLPPLCIVLVLAELYDSFGSLPLVQKAFLGVAAAAAGLVVSTGIKMAGPLRGRPVAIGFLVLVFVMVALLRWPLPAVVFGLAPFSIFAAWKGWR